MPFSFLYNVAKDVANGVYTIIQSHNKSLHSRALLREAEYTDASYGHVPTLEEGVKQNIDLGADVNATNRRGETALHLAVKRDLLHLVEYLCNQGANIEAKNQAVHREWTLTDLVEGFDHKKHFFSAIEGCGGKTPLHYAVMYKHPEIVRYLCEQGANMEAKDDSGKTPRDYLDVGYKKYYLPMVRKEFDEGYNVFLNRMNRSALEVAHSAHSNLKTSGEMVFPKSMESKYATQFAMGIISQFKSSADSHIMHKILSYLLPNMEDPKIDRGIKLVAGRAAPITPEVADVSPTVLVKRKANNENRAKRQKLSNVIDLSLDDQEVESNLKRKPKNQGGNSKRLRK